MECLPELCVDRDLDLFDPAVFGRISSSSGDINPKSCMSLNAKFSPNGFQEPPIL